MPVSVGDEVRAALRDGNLATKADVQACSDKIENVSEQLGKQTAVLQEHLMSDVAFQARQEVQDTHIKSVIDDLKRRANEADKEMVARVERSGDFNAVQLREELKEKDVELRRQKEYFIGSTRFGVTTLIAIIGLLLAAGYGIGRTHAMLAHPQEQHP
jgi:hypothetical protein